MKQTKAKNKTALKKALSAGLILAVFFAVLSPFAQAQSNEIPLIIPRLKWGADESLMSWPVEYARVEKFVVHHTASPELVPDADNSGEYKNMVKSIYNYHKNSKTWYDDDGEYIGFGDIGYNYLVDPNGNIYEGRTGGNGAIGGHVLNFNTGSVGIAVLGTYGGNVKGQYTSHTITPSIRESLEKLIGWIAANNGVDINKITDFRGKNIDGLVGHRDLTPTICPGNDLYKELDLIQKNASAYAEIYKNLVYQAGGDTAIYVLEDGYKKKFDSIDQLPEIYKNRTVKPIFQEQLEAYKYKSVITYPDGSLLREFDNPTIYYLENGQKRAIAATEAEFINMGFKLEGVKKVLASDLKIYQDGKIIKYAGEGKLIKDEKGNVFLAEKGKKRKFTSPSLFEHLGYKWKDIKEDGNVNFYLSGLDMIYPNGTLLSIAKDKNIYLIENQQRRKITSDKLFSMLGYKKDKIIAATEDERNHFPPGKEMTYPDGTLVRANNAPAVYLVENGKRKEFASAVLFEKLGYNWKNVVNIGADELNNHPQAGRVSYPDGTLIRAKDNPAVYFLEDKKKRKIASLSIFEKRKFSWKDVITVSADEMKDYLEGKAMTYPNGTLVKKKGSSAVYKIENGARKEFTSLALFETTKSKWSEVIEIGEEEFAVHPDGGILKYPEGTLIRETGKDKVYAVKNGIAEWIKTLEDFNKNGYKWANVIGISSLEISLYLNENKSSSIASNNSSSNAPASSSQTPSGNNSGASSISSGENTDKSETNAAANNPNIRIAIHSTTSDNITVSADRSHAVSYYNADGTISRTENKQSGEQTTIPYFNSSSYIRFIPIADNTIFKIASYSDPSWNKTVDDNEFKGTIEIKYSNVSQKLWVINELPLEDYINGIAEALNDSPEEYLKAFSVIARTYAMNYIKKGGKHSGEPFHLKNSRNGNGNDQVYKGYNFQLRAPKIISANKLTQEQIITFKGAPIVAAYSSDSGGVTKSGCDFLSKAYCGSDYSYLAGGIRDPENTVHDQSKITASHGVGMSAVGAYQMALNGSSWQEIIKYYYPGVEIEKYY